MSTAAGRALRKIWSSEGKYRNRKGWAKKRLFVLERDKYMCQCERCKGRRLVAHEVDHIKPLSKGGTDDYWNLRAINRNCHLIKSKREANANYVERVPIGVDGWPIDQTMRGEDMETFKENGQ
jgi:5-methylcytosine-specific restriction endonuclease McrA